MFIDNEGDPKVGAEELKAIADAESSPPSEPSSSLESDLANLRLQDDSNSSIFTIHTSATGKGSFASRDIQRGDLILSEKPIFSMPTGGPAPLMCSSMEVAVGNLPPTHLDGYLSLQNSHDTCSCFPNPLLGLFATNAIATSDGNGGVCLGASRFNHSCSPNAKYSFNSNTGEIRIYALGTIPRGEELFISYIGLYQNRRSRQENLRPGYHFTCACSICSLPDAESKKSDARRQRLKELREIIYRFDFAKANQHLNFTVEGIRLLQEEGFLEGVDDFTYLAGPICAYYSDWVSTSYWAGLTYHATVAQYGEDDSKAQSAEVRGLYLNSKSFRYAGVGPRKDFTGIRV